MGGNEITVLKSSCEHLEKISCYNSNYYKLPEDKEIKGCNVILEVCDEDYDDYTYILGKESENKFEDDSKHLRYPSSYNTDKLNDKIIIELDREGEYNT